MSLASLLIISEFFDGLQDEPFGSSIGDKDDAFVLQYSQHFLDEVPKENPFELGDGFRMHPIDVFKNLGRIDCVLQSDVLFEEKDDAFSDVFRLLTCLFRAFLED